VEALSVDAVMTELQQRVKAQVRADVLRHGASPLLNDPAIFAEVERLLRSAADRSQPAALLLPELLGEPDTWRLQTALPYRTHRGGAAGSLFIFVKRRLLMPVMRWLFEYSRDNFERQRHVNHVLFACVQELAVENARLRQDLGRLTGQPLRSESSAPADRS
jgi:hypothetical protein